MSPVNHFNYLQGTRSFPIFSEAATNLQRTGLVQTTTSYYFEGTRSVPSVRA